MVREWYAKCKDCNEEYGYSDASHRLSARRGMSRPERCPKCRKLHSREISTLGLSHFDLTPVQPIPLDGLKPGRLGGLIRPEKRVHEAREKQSSVNFAEKFGIQDEHICEYFELMKNCQVTVVVAPTGAGKSTFLPYRLMVPPEPFPPDLWTRNGQIVITQPRIQATRGIPKYVASSLHGSSLGAGFDVGFRHSGSPATDWRNKLVYMTDGTLINMIVRNELGRLSVIMIDEAHERSVNIDLILGLLKTQLPRYPHLKLIIASATINSEMFLKYYGAPEGVNPDCYKKPTQQGFDIYDNKAIANAIAEEQKKSKKTGKSSVGFYGFPGKRKFPVEERYRISDPVSITKFSGRMPEEIAKKAFDILLAMETGENSELITMTIDGAPTEPIKGNILAFLHGQKPIERAVSKLKEMIDEEPRLAGKVDVLPLFTKLPQTEQDRALKPKGDDDRIRVVISTNVAETSLTVEGIVHVIETGLLNESQWEPETQTTFVVPKQHSQAGCKQRWGRAGRVQPGLAHCLYTEEQFKSFPEYTIPEIKRAPIDQIVLTAKAAGVNDIANFNWIEPPSSEELARAPNYLRQIGALDADGDLTEHGLELRNFADEIDVANLMILADRFGCAVEMATLLPMLKLGGYTKLLLWDKSWDAPTKYTVHQIHQGLIAPCSDDIEFYLKLWEAWEGSTLDHTDETQRISWARQFFVNHELLSKQITDHRKSLLDALSGHKKDDFIRPINFDLLTRVRIVMTCGLSNQIYKLEILTDGTQETAVYKPYIVNPDKYPELVALHKDAEVQIGPESICFGRYMPDFFVCGKRQRVRIYESPLADPKTQIVASFIALIKPEWLAVVEQSPIAIARLIAAETRSNDGSLKRTLLQDRLFIDQYYQVGATFSCKSLSDGQLVEINDLEIEPQYPQISSSCEDVEDVEDIEVLEREGELDKSAGVKLEKDEVALITEVDEQPPIWTHLLEDNEADSYGSTKKSARNKIGDSVKPVGQIIFSKEEIATGKYFSAIVTGYDFSNRQQPRVNFKVPIEPDPFDQFQNKYVPGEDIDVEVISIERYVGDRLCYLVAREVETGLEIIMDPYDASLSGRNYAVEHLESLIGGDPITVTVEAILTEAKRVRISRLKISEKTRLAFLGKETKRSVDASIVEVRDDKLYVSLDPSNIKNHMPIVLPVFIEKLPNRPDEMKIGQGCQVVVSPRPVDKKPIRQSMPALPEEVKDKLEKERLANNVQYDEPSATLIANGRITNDQRRYLISLLDDNEYRRSINSLFRRSNAFYVDIKDITGLKYLATIQENKGKVPATIVSINQHGANVEINDGHRTWVPKSQLTNDTTEAVEDLVKIGETLDLFVKKVDFKDGKALLSMLDPEDDPLREYKVGQRVFGIVYNFKDDGSAAFIRLGSGVKDGYLPKNEISFSQVEDARNVLKEGQPVQVRITEIDYEKPRVTVTMRALFEKEIFVPQSHKGLVIGPGGSIIQALQEETETSIKLSDEGYSYIQGKSEKAIEAAIERINNIVSTLIYQMKLEDNRQPGMLIGSKGSNIQQIVSSSGVKIDVNSNTGMVEIIAENQADFEKAIDLIRAAIVYYEQTVQIPPGEVGHVVGKEGRTIQGMQERSGTQINVIDGDRGRLTVYAKNKNSVKVALAEIASITSSVTPVSAREGKMPPYQEVRTPLPLQPTPIESPDKLEKLREFFSQKPTLQEQSRAPEIRKPTIPKAFIEYFTPSEIAISLKDSGLYETALSITSKQIEQLTRRQTDLLAKYFGSDKSPLQKIQQATGARIIVNTPPGELYISARSATVVENAIQRIKKTIR